MGDARARWRFVGTTAVVWIALVGGVAFMTLVWMRECSSFKLAMAAVATALAALVASLGLAVTGRGTAARIAAVVVASWAAFYAIYAVCNRPTPEGLEYLRSLGDPSKGLPGYPAKDPGP